MLPVIVFTAQMCCKLTGLDKIVALKTSKLCLGLVGSFWIKEFRFCWLHA